MKRSYTLYATIALTISGYPTMALSGSDIPYDTAQRHSYSSRPWQVSVDTFMALNNPDRYAWQLFVALNWPVSSGSCNPDRRKPLGDPGMTVWESWIAKQQVYLPNATRPERWRHNCRVGSNPALPEGDYSTGLDETVKLNQLTYDYIRDNKLYLTD